MSTMRAVAIEGGKGPASALHLTDLPALGEPGKNQAIVKIAAFALNRMDISQREGKYNVPPSAPATLGVEFSGTVEKIGAGSDSPLKVGDQVFGLAAGGAYAEFILCSTFLLLPYSPDSKLSLIESAGIPEVWFTATQALIKIAEIHKTNAKSVLIHAGASGVGIACLQIARSVLGPDALLFATVGSDAKVEFVQKVPGANYGINYNKEDFVQFISDKTGGQGVDVIVDFIGAQYFNKNLATIARDGRIVMLSLMSGALVESVPIGAILFKRVRIEGSTLRSRTIEYQTELKELVKEFALSKLTSGEFVNPVDKVFSWKDIVKAHEYMESNASMGKIVCVVD